MKKKYCLFLLFIISIALLSACGDTTSTTESESTLFTQVAQANSMYDYETGILTLVGVSQTIAFSDRPIRDTYRVANSTFVDNLWSTDNLNSFYYDPPNAVLVFEMDNRQYSTTIELINAWEISSTAGIIQYLVKDLNGNIPSAKAIPTQNLAYASLYIDSWLSSAWDDLKDGTEDAEEYTITVGNDVVHLTENVFDEMTAATLSIFQAVFNQLVDVTNDLEADLDSTEKQAEFIGEATEKIYQWAQANGYTKVYKHVLLARLQKIIPGVENPLATAIHVAAAMVYGVDLVD